MNKYLSHKDSVENIIMIFVLHFLFLLSAFFIIHNLQLIFSIPLFIVISLIHHKFLGELIHEGCHYHLTKNRNINDYISNYLVGLFFFVSVANYRKKHFKHHEFQKFFELDDPETGPLKTYRKKELWKNIFFDLIGLNGILFLLNYTNLDSSSRSNPHKTKFNLDKNFLIICIIQIAIFITSITYGFILYYLIYYLTLGTLYHLQLRFRVICQHIFLNKENKIQYDLTTSRTIKGGLLEKIFFTSDITAYHNLHHDFPQYPFRKLKKLTLDNALPNDRNVFSRNRTDIIFSYYKSLL